MITIDFQIFMLAIICHGWFHPADSYSMLQLHHWKAQPLSPGVFLPMPAEGPNFALCQAFPPPAPGALPKTDPAQQAMPTKTDQGAWDGGLGATDHEPMDGEHSQVVIGLIGS